MTWFNSSVSFILDNGLACETSTFKPHNEWFSDYEDRGEIHLWVDDTLWCVEVDCGDIVSARPAYDEHDDEPWDGFNSDAEADADTLASAGWGTDEDYGGWGDDGW